MISPTAAATATATTTSLATVFNTQRMRKFSFGCPQLHPTTSPWMLRQQHTPTLMAASGTSLHSKTTSSWEDRISVHGLSESVVGVLGGGLLGRMLCQAASQMAIKVIILDPMENCPASTLSYYHMVGSYDDSATVQEFAKRCGVLTVEIEHVDADTLEKLEQQGVDCQPKASTIKIIEDKYLQKVHFYQHAIPLPEFMQSKRLAYDGRGNAVARTEEDLSSAVSALGGCDRGLYAEKWTPFVKELSVIVARGRDNTVLCYIQLLKLFTGPNSLFTWGNICHVVKSPANVSWEIMKLATDVARRAVVSLDGAGVFAVELFLTADCQVVG
ncbi:hypothetical protein ACH5RR_016537 [Cinchona calisaya]|uniref:Phosphoribosylaminoimidazole carboxylase n=1 Tax=Cinchona calisaya TaxID=153742 RepID=A0ABD2ZXE8_9GENT